MRVQHFIIATAGHVDHGKSALVKALTGTDPDRLPEEKARGITIDLGFAHLDIPASPGNPLGADRYSCGIVDVPGHEDFVRNMVAGVGSIDLALLIVAADDGWMPQTEEHLQILLHLGVTQAVVALTKADLVPDASPSVDAIRRRLAGTPFADSSVVPTSAVTGLGLDRLVSAIATLLDTTPAPHDIGRPRLWVDRVFVLRGVGTVVTGTLTGGCLHHGGAVVVHPGQRPSRIRSCQSHGHDAATVQPGTRTALNLPDLAAAASDPQSGLRRGDVVTLPGFGTATDTWDVVLERSPRTALPGCPAARPLRSGALVHLHLGSAHIPARILLLHSETLAPGARAVAQMRLERPAFAFAGDRFILRDPAQQATLAGGQILDPDARRLRSREPTRVRLLEACAADPSAPTPALQLRLHREPVTPAAALLLRSRHSAPTLAAAVEQRVEAGEMVQAGPLLVSSALWASVRATTIEAVDRHHRLHPEQTGLPLAHLRSLLAREHGFTIGFEELILEMVRGGWVTQGADLRRASHRPALPAALQTAGRALREALLRLPLDPPGRAELTPNDTSRQALRHLLGTGEIVEIGPDVVLAADALALARTRIRTFLRRQGQATTSEIRQHLGTSRRVLIPLLEKLDREGLTRRDGDHRFLAQGGAYPQGTSPA